MQTLTKDIMLDCTPLDNGHAKRGIGEYVHRLLEAYGDAKFKNFKQIRIKNLTQDDTIISITRPSYPKVRLQWLWNQIFLSKTVLKNNPRLIHYTDPYATIYIKGLINIATVYDLIPTIFPDKYFSNNPLDVKIFWNKYIEELRKMDHIISISNSTKNDLINYLDIDARKISVVPLAPFSNISIKPKEFPNSQKNKYFLYVGGHDHRKNIPLMLEAFAKSCGSISENLILVGSATKDELSRLNKTISKFSLDHRVKHLGYVTDETLQGLYSNATSLIFLSYHEGFGLPVLEAMQHGLPVITSPNGALSEVAGDAGIFVNLNDIRNISEAIIQVANSNSLKVDIGRKAIAQSKIFTWDKTAKMTIDIYENLLK